MSGMCSTKVCSLLAVAGGGARRPAQSPQAPRLQMYHAHRPMGHKYGWKAKLDPLHVCRWCLWRGARPLMPPAATTLPRLTCTPHGATPHSGEATGMQHNLSYRHASQSVLQACGTVCPVLGMFHNLSCARHAVTWSTFVMGMQICIHQSRR